VELIQLSVQYGICCVGMLEEDQGRKICWPPGMSVPLTVVKSDGGFTYDTSDMAAVRHRLKDERADMIFYVVDQGQVNNMKTLSFTYSSSPSFWYMSCDSHIVGQGFYLLSFMYVFYVPRVFIFDAAFVVIINDNNSVKQ